MNNHPPLEWERISSMMLSLLDNRKNFSNMLPIDAKWVEENPFQAIRLFIDAVRKERSKPFLKRLHTSSDLIIPAANNRLLPLEIIENFKNGYRPIPHGTIKSPETPITVHTQVRDGTSLDLFGNSLKELAKKSFSLSQIAGFCAKFLELYKNKCHNILFLLKDEPKFIEKDYQINGLIVVRLGVMPNWSFHLERLDSESIHSHLSTSLPYNNLVVLPRLK